MNIDKKDKFFHFIFKICIPIFKIISPILIWFIVRCFNPITKLKILSLDKNILRLKKVLSKDNIALLLPSKYKIFGVMFELKLYYLIILLLILIIFTKQKSSLRNNKVSFNYKNAYLDYPIFIFRLAKILGYSTLDMKYVPIPMQFYLLIHQIFDDQLVSDNNNDKYYPPVNCKVTSQIYLNDEDSNEITIFLQDTYLFDDTIINSYKNTKNFIIISRERAKAQRVYSQSFVDEVVATVISLRKKYVNINIFAYTNPLHNYYISKGAFNTPESREKSVNLFFYSADPKKNFSFYSKGCIKINLK